MKIEEAIDILEKHLNCQQSEEEHCKQHPTCSDCPYDVDEDVLPVAIKTVISRWEHLKKYLKEQELLYSVNYKDIEKHEMIVSVIEEMEHDPD